MKGRGSRVISVSCHEKYKHVADDDEKLQQRGERLVHALDDDSVHGGHVIGDAGHDFSRGVRIEPLHGQALELVVEFDAHEMGELEFEGVVDVGAQREEKLAGEDGPDADGGGGQDEVRAVLADDHIDEAHGHAGQHQHQRGAGHGQQQREAALQRETQRVADDPQED